MERAVIDSARPGQSRAGWRHWGWAPCHGHCHSDQSMEQIHVPAVADVDVNAAQSAFERASIQADDIAICDCHRTALSAIERGKRVIVEDAKLLLTLPIDVVVESTGSPEAGARHALAAIHHDKHAVMVNKETDRTVGPILARWARQVGVVYTPVNGSQLITDVAAGHPSRPK